MAVSLFVWSLIATPTLADAQIAADAEFIFAWSRTQPGVWVWRHGQSSPIFYDPELRAGGVVAVKDGCLISAPVGFGDAPEVEVSFFSGQSSLQTRPGRPTVVAAWGPEVLVHRAQGMHLVLEPKNGGPARHDYGLVERVRCGGGLCLVVAPPGDYFLVNGKKGARARPEDRWVPGSQVAYNGVEIVDIVTGRRQKLPRALRGAQVLRTSGGTYALAQDTLWTLDKKLRVINQRPALGLSCDTGSGRCGVAANALVVALDDHLATVDMASGERFILRPTAR